MRENPAVAFIDCNDCRKYLYNLKTGERDKFRGKDVLHSQTGGKPPCEIPASGGCPKGHWSKPKTLNRRNIMALVHYQECKAVDDFPRDESGRVESVVRHNARIITNAEKAAPDAAEGGVAHLLLAMLGGRK